MEILQYIICCMAILLLPPMTWIYALIYWVWNGCKIKMFFLDDVAICEFWDDDTNKEEIIILQQMIENKYE